MIMWLFLVCVIVIILGIGFLFEADRTDKDWRRGPGTMCSNQTHPADRNEGIDTFIDLHTWRDRNHKDLVPNNSIPSHIELHDRRVSLSYFPGVYAGAASVALFFVNNFFETFLQKRLDRIEFLLIFIV